MVELQRLYIDFLRGNKMEKTVTIPLQKFCEDNALEIIWANRQNIFLTSYSITRPGLELSGFFEGFDSRRIIVLGKTEDLFLSSMDEKLQNERIKKLLSYKEIPCIIVARDMPITNALKQQAIEANCPILRSKKITSVLMNDLFYYLNILLAPQTNVHGVLMDVSGVGVLIIGNSGIGKSETAIELIKRGHRLVTDDNVLIKRISKRLVGYAPERIQHFLELRGIGIINVKEMYGSGSILMQKDVKLVIELEAWQADKEYERLGNKTIYHDILGVKVMKYIIPVKPGRNLSIIIESATRNYIAQSFGYNSAQDLLEKTMMQFQEKNF